MKQNVLHVDYDELVLQRADGDYSKHAHGELIVPEGAEIRILGVASATDHVVQYITYHNEEKEVPDEDKAPE